VASHRGEVWGLDVDPAQQRLATGSADAELRLYSIHRPDSTGVQQYASVGSHGKNNDDT
jgi:hypothetical protein